LLCFGFSSSFSSLNTLWIVSTAIIFKISIEVIVNNRSMLGNSRDSSNGCAL
jgi:hypothetical protein